MTRLVYALAIAALAVLASPSAAPAQSQDPPAADDANRYSLHRAGEGFVRLDAHTGRVSQCGWHGSGWSCTAAADERAALESEIARLQRENVALKRSLLARGLELPPEVKPEPPAPKEPEVGAVPKMPSDAEIDRALAFMKNIWRRLVEMMVDLQRDIQRKS
jgi:hypothetical protein